MKRAKKWLGNEPTVDSKEAAELALQEIAAINARDAELSAAYDLRMRKLNEEREATLATKIDGESVAFNDRVAQLEAALLAWGDTDGVKLLKGRSKTLELRNGTFNWRKKADAVVFLDNWDQKSAVAKLWKNTKLRPMLDAVLEKVLNLFGAVTIDLKIDRTQAKKAVIAGQLAKNRLGAIGLRFVPGVEYVSVAVADIARDGTGENVEL